MTSLDDYLFWLNGKQLNVSTAKDYFIRIARQIRQEYNREFWLHGDNLYMWTKEFNKFFNQHGIPYCIISTKYTKRRMFIIRHK